MPRSRSSRVRGGANGANGPSGASVHCAVVGWALTVVGSNVANVLLILGVGALITPIACARPTLLRDGAALVVATLACVLAALAGGFGRPVGGVFLVLLALYLFVCIRQEDGAAGAGAEAGGWPFWLGALAALGGLALTVLGARLLVAGSVRLAAGAGIPETVIGLSVVAVGTSLPELVTTVTAARRGQTDIAFGNVIGSNIYNILGILGVTALVHPIEAPPGIVAFDLWVMAGTTLLLLAFAWTGRRLSRGEGAALLVGYAVYLGALVVVEA